MARSKRIHKMRLIEARKGIVAANQMTSALVEAVDNLAGMADTTIEDVEDVVVVEEVVTPAVKKPVAKKTASRRRSARTTKSTTTGE